MPIWSKGQSGNIHGRPKGWASMAKYIRDNTESGREMVDFHLKVFRGETLKTQSDDPEEVVAMVPTIRDRQESCDWLANRGFGKPPEVMVEEGELGEDITKTMTDAELLAEMTPKGVQ